MRRAILNVNGVSREFLCKNDDSLADVLRKQGLTGTKIACRSGHCGACSLLLDGKLVRACIRKMKSVADNAIIETIEGFGTAENPHPLQQAFLTYAAVQCGFCSPGFILSAKALLNQNPSPTRLEIREWFTKNNNVCRCTGYKPIIDAVMEAAAVMRGEKNMQDIMPKESDSQIYGTDFVKPNGMSRVLGSCDFGGDIALKMPSDTYHLALVIARTHRAKINKIDYTEALSMPGIHKVITAEEVKGTNRFFAPQASPHSLCHGNDRPVICDTNIRRWGDIIAVVAGRSREEARAAAQKVVVDITEQKPILSVMDAAAKDAERVHDDLPNIYIEQPLYKGDNTKDMFDSADVVSVEGSFSTTRQPHMPIEPDIVQAYPHSNENGDGVTIQCKTQFLYGIIGQMANAIGVDAKNIRVIGNPAGGSFGYSMSPATYALTAACALALNAPVSLDMSYEEHQHVTGKRAPVNSNARLACDKNGKLLAMEYLVGVDHGAYSEMAGALSTKIIRFMGYYYDIPNLRGLARMAFTNQNFGTAYRAFGSPQTYMMSEQMIDMLAIKMGMDPFDFRYKNLALEGTTSPTSVPYREYVMKDLMDKARPFYEEGKKRAAELSTDKVKYGVGIALGGYHVSKLPDHSEVDIELRPDNGVNVYSTWADVGQGADFGILSHTHEALKVLNMKPSQIHNIANDTFKCPDTGPASGSRSHHVAGNAIYDAARQLLDALRKADGSYMTYDEYVKTGDSVQLRFNGVHKDASADIHRDTGHGYGNIAQNHVVFVAEVSVDLETGKTKVERANIIADAGVVGSKHAVLGQAWGGFAHSIGFALTENYDDMKKHETLRGAGVVRCIDVPDDMNVVLQETPRETPHGSTGCAEGFQSSGHVSILNAINNATNVRITTLPASPEKVKAGLEALANGKKYSQEAWDLGCDLYERLEYLQKTRVEG